jgi:transposase
VVENPIKQLSYEQLLELVLQLQAENARLRADIELLKQRPPQSGAPFSKNKRKEKPNRPGRKPGQGSFKRRAAPAPESYSAPPEEVPVAETACPGCGGELGAETAELVTVTELPEIPQPVVKAYRVNSRSCGQCHRTMRGRHPDVAPDQSGATAHRLGPRAQAAMSLLHYHCGLPVRRVPQVLQHLTGLSVTQSAVTQAALRAGTKHGPVQQVYQQIRQQIPQETVVHTDDTGWRENGERRHLMVFETPRRACYQIRPQHRNDEVREVIGDAFAGVLVTDRGSSYNSSNLREVKQQKCLSHLDRTLEAVLAEPQAPRARQLPLQLQRLLKQGWQLWRDFHDPQKPVRNFDRQVRQLEQELTWQLRERRLSDPHNQRLVNELGWHHDQGNLLRFLHDPVNVPPTNNAAERALRPAVIARKVSHCSKNARGAEAHAAFTSVIGTLKKQGYALLHSLTRILTPHAEPLLL